MYHNYFNPEQILIDDIGYKWYEVWQRKGRFIFSSLG